MNVGENKKRRLNRALQRFAAMLIEEASDLSGLPKSKLAEAMGLSDDQVKRYIHLPGMKNSRAPQAAAVQQLENRVAKLLKRSAHTVVVENNTKLGGSDAYFSEGVEGRPGDDLNLREFDLGSFQLGYEGDWPTYRRLKTHQAWATGSVNVKSLIKNRVPFERWPEMLRSYAWQWGILWERGVPWLSREAFGVAADVPLETFLPELTGRAKQDRRAVAVVGGFSHGQKLVAVWEQALISGEDGRADECLALIRTAAIAIESLVATYGISHARAMLNSSTQAGPSTGQAATFDEPSDQYLRSEAT